jgi:hypothetical protein
VREIKICFPSLIHRKKCYPTGQFPPAELEASAGGSIMQHIACCIKEYILAPEQGVREKNKEFQCSFTFWDVRGMLTAQGSFAPSGNESHFFFFFFFFFLAGLRFKLRASPWLGRRSYQLNHSTSKKVISFFFK